jgi:hypothetical protein
MTPQLLLKNGAFDGRREIYPDHGALSIRGYDLVRITPSPIALRCRTAHGKRLHKGNQESAVLKLEFVDFFDIYSSVQLEQRRIIGKKTDPICRFRKF